MKTPYDGALRVAERRLEDVRTAIGEIVADLGRIEAALDRTNVALRQETLFAAGDHRLVADAYFGRTRFDRARLSADRSRAHARLEALRQQAVTCFAERQAVETAAITYREEAARQLDAAEQGALDDLAASRHIRRGRAAAQSAAPVP